jgi:hypothetical protein
MVKKLSTQTHGNSFRVKKKPPSKSRIKKLLQKQKDKKANG